MHFMLNFIATHRCAIVFVQVGSHHLCGSDQYLCHAWYHTADLLFNTS